MSEARIQLDAQVQVRRDIEANWAAVDPVLRDGEIAYSKDLNRIKVGDGARKWSELEYMAGSSASLSLDTEMSDTSENAVQNKVIKAYVDGKAKDAQAAAEQYIQDEVLTDYATTKYVGEREEYIVGYAEGLVNDLEKDIDGRGYLTSAAMGSYATKEDIKGFVTKGSTLGHYGITDAVKVGGRETTGSANDIETPSIVGYTNGMTDTPFTYGTLLTMASNPTYYVGQIAVRTNGIMAFRGRNDSKAWTDWKTVVDSSNIGDFALPKTGGTITGNLTVNGFIYGSVPSGSDLPGYVIVKNGNSLIIQATQGNVNNKDGNIILGGYGVPAQVIKLESILTYLTGDLTVIGGITLGNKKISSWDEIAGSGNYLPLTGGTIDGSLKINGGFKVEETKTGNYAQFASGVLEVRGRIEVVDGYPLWVGGKGILEWTDLDPILGLGSLAYKDEADVVMAGASYSTGSDLNDVKTAGIYTVYGGVTNAAAGGSMITLASANPYYIGQITVKYNGEMYSRSFVPENGGVWSNWRTLIDSVNVGDYTLPKTGGVITGALTVKANFQANANILIEAGSIKFLSQGNIEGVGSIIHKLSSAYNIDQYGNIYAPSGAGDDNYWNFRRGDGLASFYIYSGTGKVQTDYDTTLVRLGGLFQVGTPYSKADARIYGTLYVGGDSTIFDDAPIEYKKTSDGLNKLVISRRVNITHDVYFDGALTMAGRNIEGVGAIVHKYAGAYNMDEYGNFYAASTATDSSYWNFKRADGKDVFRILAGTGTVETAYDTVLGRNGGADGCTISMGNEWNRANTNVYGDFKVIGYPAEFKNGITLGSETITSWDSLKSGWWNQRLVTLPDAPIAIDHLSYINISRELNSNDNITIEIRNSYSFYMATLIFATGSTIPNFTLIETGRSLIWENGINVFNNLEPNTIYKIDIDYTYAAVTTYNR